MAEQKQQDHIVMLTNARLAFPNLWEPQGVRGDDRSKPSFGGSFILTPDHPDIAKMRQAIAAVANAKWGERGPEILKGLIAGDRVCLHNGDTKTQYDGFAGNWFVSTRSSTRPLIIGPDKSQLSEADGKPYAGCFVNAQIAIWAQDNQHGKRVNAQLRGVQFLRDGDAFGGGGVADVDEFADVSAESADADAPAVDAEGWGDLV